jgi:hypothetical protein
VLNLKTIALFIHTHGLRVYHPAPVSTEASHEEGGYNGGIGYVTPLNKGSKCRFKSGPSSNLTTGISQAGLGGQDKRYHLPPHEKNAETHETGKGR